MKRYDVIVIGAGPSGLMCSYFLTNKKVLLVDKNEDIGGKIKVSGGGRCNVTNLKDIETFLNFVPRNNKFLFSTLNKFNNYDIYDFFINNNVKLKEEDHNRIFPVTNKSQTIIDVFKNMKHVDYLLEYSVNSIRKEGEEFIVDEKFVCEKVVVATGGKTYSHLGTTGDGYKFAKNFGHSITDLIPCEVALTSIDDIIREKLLQGITVYAHVTLLRDNKSIFKIKQSILFTHFGLSGPAALCCSYFINDKPNHRYELEINVINDIPKRIKKYLDEENNIKIKISGTRGFKTAFVTGGGVNIKEINPKSFESKLVSNLYFIGEVNDVNAFTGGYNITINFSQGYSCANAINSNK